MKNLLSGISKANGALLENGELKTVLSKLVAVLGASTDVDRCYIFTNKMEDGQLFLDYTHEWCKPGIDPQIDNPDLQNISYEMVPGIFEELSNGRHMYGKVAESDNKFFRDAMEFQGILSYLFVPIFYNNLFWGWMGYDDCTVGKTWESDEADALFSVANNVGLRLTREKAERENALALERFDLSVKASQQGLWEWDIANDKLYYSVIFMEMIGYQHSEFEHTYENWKKRVHPNDYPIVEIALNAYLKRQLPSYTSEFRFLHKNGYYVWVRGSGVAKWDAEGNPIYIVGSHLDISQLKYQQEYLEVQRNEFNLLLNSLGEAVFRLNNENQITFLNSYWKEISGHDARECMLKEIESFFFEEDIEAIRENIRKLKSFASQRSFIEVRLKHAKGNWRWVQMVVKEFGNPGENDYFIAGSIIDVHDKKLAFEKEKELAELKSGFVSLTSHQFRTPLTVIFSNIELIEFYTEDVDPLLYKRIRKSAGQIKGEVDRMTELMNNILLVGRYDSNQLQYNLKPLYLSPIIDAIVQTYFSNEPDKRKIIVLDNARHVKVSVDEMLFTHVLTNIISNAFKYSAGSDNPELVVAELPGIVEIRIIDKGIGIPENELEKVFNSFYRATNTISFMGSGLGLVVAKQFMELHNGSIVLESELGKGTTVVLSLPLS